MECKIEGKEAIKLGKDELYRIFWKCPICHYSHITDDMNYCPKCGKKIRWKK